MKRQHQRGVTLMELLTVVAVLGIIAAIAVPSYRRYLVRAQRSDAKTALLQIQAAQERFYLQANKYTTNLTDKMPNGLGVLSTSSNGYYQISIDSGADQDFIARATPITGKGQSDDKLCTEFSIDSTGKRDSKGTATVADCWR
jgi:type IV pilus assembly protein PilE